MKRDNFKIRIRRILAERAGQHCSRPECGRATSGPSDNQSGESTVLGRACHITAASAGGPRYDPTLTPDQRSHSDNGIWLCAICADEIDKKENEAAFPAELLRNWKDFHESVVGTDHGSQENRRAYPIRQLSIMDFAGVRGEANISFGAVTLIVGTMKLSRTIGRLLRIFSDRDTFENTRQPAGGDTFEYGRIPLPDGRKWVITTKLSRRREFTSVGKLRLQLSDGREFIITTERTGATLSLGDTPVPVFFPVIRTIIPGAANRWKLSRYADADSESDMKSLSQLFGVSLRELKASIEGVPTDKSVFHFDYAFEADKDLVVSVDPTATHLPVSSLSSGEQARLIVDLAVRLAKYSANIGSTILLLDQASISMDSYGWASLLEWLEREHPPFQTVVDMGLPPSTGKLRRTLCYEAEGNDMDVSKFKLKSWKTLEPGRQPIAR